jgi:hypothetical protein
MSINPPWAHLAQFLQVLTHRCLQGDVHRVRIDAELGCHLCRDARGPVEPRIAFGSRQLENMGDGLRPIHQFALETGQAHLVGLRLDHLVDRARLEQGRAACWQCRWPVTRGAAGFRHGDLYRAGGCAIARRIGIARPFAVDALGINRSVCLRRDPSRSDGLAHRRIGHPRWRA